MVEYGVCLRAPEITALILCFVLLTACDKLSSSDEPHTLTTTPAPPLDTPSTEGTSLEPTGEPTPSQALNPDHVWVGVEGTAAKIAAVSPDGDVTIVDIPLNEGQQASSLVASRDGSHLAYLVWDGDNQQHGIAAWDLSEPNARLVATPLPGYRIIALILSNDGAGLAYTQVAADSPLDSADWRIDTTTPDGSEPVLVGSREMFGDSPPLMPIAWPIESLLVLSSAAPSFEAQSIVSVSPTSGTIQEIAKAPEAQFISSPSVSPDGSQIAYLLIDADRQSASAVQIADLTSGDSFTLEAPQDQDIYGLRWNVDGQRLLLDLIRPAGDDPGQLEQYWAWASINQPSEWSQSSPGPGREGLFDYEPYDEGVVYTLLPLDNAWEVYLLPDVASSEPPRVTPLDSIAQENSAPSIVYSPIRY